MCVGMNDVHLSPGENQALLRWGHPRLFFYFFLYAYYLDIERRSTNQRLICQNNDLVWRKIKGSTHLVLGVDIELDLPCDEVPFNFYSKGTT